MLKYNFFISYNSPITDFVTSYHCTDQVINQVVRDCQPYEEYYEEQLILLFGELLHRVKKWNTLKSRA